MNKIRFIMIKFLVYFAIGYIAYTVAHRITPSFDSGWFGGLIFFALCRLVDIFFFEENSEEN